MLFQGSALFDSMTVWQNVAYPLVENTKLSFEEIDKRVMALLDFVELPEVVEKLPGALSGGMKKRVALARALVAQPEYIFYDEPTTGLDPITASKINLLIKKTQNEYGTTSMVVTHDMVSALTVGDFFAFMHEGEIAFAGNRDEVMKSNVTELQDFIADAEPEEILKKFLNIE